MDRRRSSTVSDEFQNLMSFWEKTMPEAPFMGAILYQMDAKNREFQGNFTESTCDRVIRTLQLLWPDLVQTDRDEQTENDDGVFYTLYHCKECVGLRSHPAVAEGCMILVHLLPGVSMDITFPPGMETTLSPIFGGLALEGRFTG